MLRAGIRLLFSHHEQKRASLYLLFFLYITLNAAAIPTRIQAYDGQSFGMTLLSRQFTGTPHDVLVADDMAFVALDSGLQVYDVFEADNPKSINHLYLPSPALDLAAAPLQRPLDVLADDIAQPGKTG